MKTRNWILSAWLLGLPLTVSAQEASVETAPVGPGPATSEAQVPLAQTPAPVFVPAPEPVAPTPEPVTGWGRGKRAPMYVNMMMLGGVFFEDSGNRLTTRDSKTLEGVGGVFRIGAVIDERNRLGLRLQSFMRPTKKIVRSEPVAVGASEWGSANFMHAGPEYIYTCPKGFYAGGSLGLGMAMTMKTLKNDHKGDDVDNLEHAAAGFSGVLSVGYEWRFSKWFALNTEAYGGFFRGVDDDEKNMTSTHFGLGMGVGF